jgi:hypothetical protein
VAAFFGAFLLLDAVIFAYSGTDCVGYFILVSGVTKNSKLLGIRHKATFYDYSCAGAVL